MFEHLGHIGRKNFELKKDRPLVLPGLLGTSLLIFVMSFFMQAGVRVGAVSSPQADLVVNQNASQIVPLGQIPVFEFIINAHDKDIRLNSLKIYANGLYDIKILNNLKLYHQGAQLDTAKKLDQAGNIYFETEDYVLELGQNQFYLMLNVNDGVRPGDFLQFSLPDETSVVLKKNGHVFTPNADYPLLSGGVSFVTQGSIAVYNNLPSSRLAAQNEIIKIADFRLVSSAETIDINQIILEAAWDIDLDDSIFYLLQGSAVLSYGQINNSQIVFDFKPQVVPVNQNIELQIIAQDLPLGQNSFYLENILGTGFISGQNIVLDQRLSLGETEIKKSFLQFQNNTAEASLVEGRQTLSDILITALGADTLGLQKMTWKIDYQNLDITDFKVSIDDRLYQTGLNIQDDKISIYWDEPVDISDGGVHIKLLAEIAGLKPGAQVQTYLLSDIGPLNQDNMLDSNIIWTDHQDIFDGYLLPDLPLEPSILTQK